MKLYHDPLSAPSRAVVSFLIDEGLAFDEEIVDLMAGDHLQPAYGMINANRQVPALVDDGFRLTEGSAILKYLGDKYASPAYAVDPHARARINEALDWFNTNFHTYFCHYMVYTSILPDYTSMNAVSRADLEHLGALRSRKYFEILDRHMLKDRDFVCGDEISIADYLGAAFVTLGETISYDLRRYPNVTAWVARMKSRAGWEPAYATCNGFLSALRADPERMAAVLAAHP